ncbi:MAG: repeat containing protein [Bacteroidetes bacterium]|nr:repeat containing protein [Bacteroidota bacterium]
MAFSPSGTETYLSNPGCAGFAVLPIELTDFYAASEDEAVRLIWKVASEINTVEYKIEKSLDAVNWIKIGTVLPDKVHDRNLVYQSLDYSPVKGINYYRLSDVGAEGKITYQPIISFNYLNKNSNFYYTQNEDDLIITSNGFIHNATINLLDVTGRILKKIIVDENSPAFVSKRDIGKGLFLIQCETYPQLGVSKIIVN